MVQNDGDQSGVVRKATSSGGGGDASGKVAPRRLRWSVPAVDVSTNRWLDLQHDVSHSLQLLIRESIQRDGYIDVVNRPIEQLPRRGRPPQQSESSDDASTESSENTAVEQTSPANDELDDKSSPAGDQEDRQPPVQPERTGLDAFLTR